MTLCYKNILSLLRSKLKAAAIGIALPTLCLVGVVSCTGSEDAPDTDPSNPALSGDISVGITFSVSSGAPLRAPGYLGSDYDAGSGFENFVDIPGGDFRFYFFDEENLFHAPLNVETIIPVGGNASTKHYMATGIVERGFFDSKNLKLVILANWKTYPDETQLVQGVTSIDDICGQIYDFSPEMMVLSEENTIPLYGVSNTLEPKFNGQNKADLGTMHLLRAFAKIEVIQGDASYDIEKVELNRYNTRGYCGPTQIYSKDDYVHGNYEQDYANTPHIPAGAFSDTKIPFLKSANNSYVVYVPEFDNLTDAGKRSTIEIKFKHYKETYILEFRYYNGVNDSRHFDILRNYWYRYTIRKKGVIVQVVPYSEVVLNPIFGLGNHLELVEIEINNEKFYYDRETGIYYQSFGGQLIAIDNPYFGDTDPVTGWSIRRDDNNLIIAYYDAKTGKAYAINKITEILDPQNHVEADNPSMMRVSAPDGHLFYYHHKTESNMYAPDKVTSIQNPFDYYDKTDDIVRYVSRDRNNTFGYYSIADGQWLAPDRSTAIQSPFDGHTAADARYKYTSADGTKVFGYYSTADRKWYDAATDGKEIKNPF